MKELDLLFPELDEPPKSKKSGLSFKAYLKKVHLLSSAMIVNISIQMGVCLALVMAANMAISHIEGDPLRDMYAQNPEAYGPDAVALYDARNTYCRPSFLRKWVLGFDQATCTEKEASFSQYSAKVQYALAVAPHSARQVHSDSFDVLVSVRDNDRAFRYDRKADTIPAAPQ